MADKSDAPEFIEHETGDKNQPVALMQAEAMIVGKTFKTSSSDELVEKVFKPLVAKMKAKLDPSVELDGAVGISLTLVNIPKEAIDKAAERRAMKDKPADPKLLN